jgi:hypothetical protein
MKDIFFNWKLTIIFFLIAHLFMLIIAISKTSQKHQCIDETHQTCDGNCECDGIECDTHYHNGQECQYEGLECPILSKTLNLIVVLSSDYNTSNQQRMKYSFVGYF